MGATVSTTIQRSRARPVWIVWLLASVLLLGLPFLFRLDGRPHSDWQQFLGRFHPLTVHLPIGLILLVPVLEFAGRSRPALRETAEFVLSLSALACFAALTLGYLLAYGSGDAGRGVSRHMWGGILLTIAVMLCLLLRRGWASGKLAGYHGHTYPTALTATLLLLAWTAHQGGSLTHGSNYLTEYLPASLKHWKFSWTAQAKTTVPPDSFYAQQIHPILDSKCVSCHGQPEVKGGLRLDSYDALMKGGNEGAVVVAGHPERSILLQRVTLPPDQKKFMPAEGKPALTQDEIALLRAWIAQGASPTAASIAGIAVQEKEAAPPPVGDYSALMPAITQTARAAGVTIVQVSRDPADGLILNAIDASAGFTDAKLASFVKFAPYIVELDLQRTSVTDACFDNLEKFGNLRALHLDDTSIAGNNLSELTQLKHLTYLNLSGTKVTQPAIAPIASMKQLRHVYFFNTLAQPVGANSSDRPPARKTP